MSGGSYNYVYRQIEDIELRHLTPERIAFQKHLKLVAAAMQAIEWVDSCDKSPGDESEAIRKCIPIAAVIEALIEQAEAIIGQLREEIARAKEARSPASSCWADYDNTGATMPSAIVVCPTPRSSGRKLP